MSTTAPETTKPVEPVDKGLKGSAVGLLSSVVIGLAATAPAYSVTATLGFIVIAVSRKPSEGASRVSLPFGRI